MRSAEFGLSSLNVVLLLAGAMIIYTESCSIQTRNTTFFGAIAGVRSRFGKAALILPRGVPTHLSWPATCYFKDVGASTAGWLLLSEIDQCISHVDTQPFDMDFELRVMLEFMRSLVTKLSDPHVRLVFNIVD